MVRAQLRVSWVVDDLVQGHHVLVAELLHDRDLAKHIIEGGTIPARLPLLQETLAHDLHGVVLFLSFAQFHLSIDA